MFIDANKWLKAYLKDGKPHELKKLQSDARGYGLVRSDLKAARREIGGVITEKSISASGKTVYAWRRKR